MSSSVVIRDKEREAFSSWGEPAAEPIGDVRMEVQRLHEPY